MSALSQALALPASLAQRTIGQAVRPVARLRDSAQRALGRRPNSDGRVLMSGQRIHVQVRLPEAARYEAYATRLEEVLGEVPGVRAAHAVLPLAIVAVEVHGDARPDRLLVEGVESVEREFWLHERPLPPERSDPADAEAMIRAAGEIWGDLIGIGLSLGRRVFRPPIFPVEVDLAALASIVRATPVLRRKVEERLGSTAANVALALANGVAAGLAGSIFGPGLDLAHRSLVLGEAAARRSAMADAEPHLMDGPPGGREAPGPARPVKLPDGPVERYSGWSRAGSVAGFGGTLLATRNLERAMGALYSGLPTAAVIGRDGYAATVSRTFASRGAVPLNQAALRRLDRVDVLILDGDVVSGPGEATARGSELLLRAARRADLQVFASGGEGRSGRLDLRPLPDGVRLADAIRNLQSEGRVVALVTATPGPAPAAADVCLGLRRAGRPPVWNADILSATDDLSLAVLLVDAIGAARRVSRQSVGLAAAGAGVASLLTFGAPPTLGTRRVMTAVNMAASAALVNGIRSGVAVARRPFPDLSEPIPWHALEADDVLSRLGTSREGLDPDEARKRSVPMPGPPPAPLALARAIGGEVFTPLTPVLAGGAGLSAMVGSAADAALVGGVAGFNAVLSGVQRFGSDRAMARLSRQTRQMVTVIRRGREGSEDARRLVPGDIVRLKAGEVVPADCRLLEADALEVEESALTGESVTVAKDVDPVTADALGDRTSVLFDGTSVASGNALAVVVATGEDTEARRGLAAAEEEPAASGVEARLRSLTRLTTPVAVAGGIAAMSAGLIRGRPVREMASAGVSLAVAAVPEGLPLLATVAEQAAAKRLSKRKALVRNPRALEALGRIDVVCADKTGTLTQGRLRLVGVSTGTEIEDVGNLSTAGSRVLAVGLRATPHEDPDSTPHPTDRAVIHGAREAGIEVRTGARGWKLESVLPFEPARGYHAAVGRTGGGMLLAVKGAPEVILPRCTEGPNGRALPDTRRQDLEGAADRLASQGIRILAVAQRRLSDGAEADDDAGRELRFLGFLCLRDPVRKEAVRSIEELRSAGVEVVMITGDHPSTAQGVAVELGLDGGRKVITGPELDEMPDEALAEALADVSVFARVTPTHKVRLVRAFQRAGRAVAMTGDGANDAPAIRLADVGIALGTHGPDAARDAADVVLVDERIETLLDAVVEGRGMWRSVREAVGILVGGNLGEVGFTVAGTLIGGRTPLNARQLLLVNLLTDVAPAMAVAVRSPRGVAAEDLLREGPEASLGQALNDAIVWRALTTAGGATAGWMAARLTGRRARAETVALASLVGTQLGQTLSTGWRDPAVVAAGLGSAAVMGVIIQTPGLSHLFGCRPLGPLDWAQALTASSGATLASMTLPRLAPGLPARVLGMFERLPW